MAFKSSATENYYSNLPKTPLPKPDDLCEKELGASKSVEYLARPCTCDVPVPHFGFALAIAAAGHVDPDAKTRAVLDFMNEKKLKMCCRNIILHPTIDSIVSADIGAFYVHPSVREIIGATTSDAPRAIMRTKDFAPPHVLLHAKKDGTSDADFAD